MPARIACLLSWSSTTISALRPSQSASPGLGMDSRFPAAVEIGNAAAADFRVGGIRTDIGAVVPAALALGVRARRDLDGSSAIDRACLRGDQHETQVIAQAAEQFIAL